MAGDFPVGIVFEGGVEVSVGRVVQLYGLAHGLADFLDVAGVGGALHENEGKGCQKKDDVLHEGSP